MTTEEVILYTFYTFDLEMTAEIVYDTLRPRRCDEIIGKLRHVGLGIWCTEFGTSTREARLHEEISYGDEIWPV